MLPLEPRALLNGPGPDPLEAFPSSIGGNRPLLTPSASVLPLSSVPQLSSRSGATVKLYLDFVGAAPTSWGSYSVPATPAYDTDNDPTSFSSGEMNQIQEVWSRVAEKYSPFNVDVTTVDPHTYPYNKVVRIVVGGDGAWAGGVYGGYSYVDGFTGTTSNTGWVFAKNLGKGLPAYVGEAAAHEAGHNFGLYHQSIYDTNGNKIDEYFHGSAETAPIMGFSYYAQRGLWWSGYSSASFTTQSDLEILAGAQNGFGYRDDDHGNSRALADVLTIGADGKSASAYGVIETTADVDYFKFTSTGGLVDLKADVAPFGAMLDLALTLTDANGNVLDFQDAASLGERITMEVGAGDFYLAVSSHQGYGDIGQYFISGNVVPEPASAALVLLLAGGWLMQRPRQERYRKSTFSVAEIPLTNLS
jgi:serralysin